MIGKIILSALIILVEFTELIERCSMVERATILLVFVIADAFAATIFVLSEEVVEGVAVEVWLVTVMFACVVILDIGALVLIVGKVELTVSMEVLVVLKTVEKLVRLKGMWSVVVLVVTIVDDILEI